MKAYKIILSFIRSVASGWAILTFAVMTVAVLLQVGGRYFFNYSIAEFVEVATLSQIWMVLIGAGVAAREDIHARVDVLVNKFPLTIKRGFFLATAFLGIVFLASVMVGAFPMIENGQYQTTPTLGIPMWIPYLGLVLGPAYFIVEVIDLTVRQWSAGGQPLVKQTD
jgi:TRAP-type C4-dicarboxylate transport system permease small subunit